MMSEWSQNQQQEPSASQQQPTNPSGVPASHGMGSTSGGLWGIHIDIHHFIRTIPGILRLVQFLFGIICIACSAPAQKAGTHWFLFVVVISFLLTFLWIVVYFFTIKDVFKSLPWNMIEMGCHGALSVLYLTAFITQLSIWSPPVQSGAGANLAAGSFGLFNFILYCASTYFAFVEWKAEPIRS
ncbi:CKLF-like MARVEL transmembrane domain-containing protein 8 [Cloeon dipterum]|uniref:CKLF-like MARVEL transmembrane domain-containing protein 8 n=1 Tax=Cloeon dipterum TaxID=197152 RepID=UPI0032208575